ncbi:condensation domain-containing protein, partial [Maribacter sp. 2-571]|uniref:condensation domain-containing protein n=1 Tax=Maribacter sp. 2-571 TaxID=3417569 RepID=UPI003D341A00
EGHVAPATELEAQLCGIWASVLGLEQVGITDNFFKIGGDSILAMQLAHRINEERSIGVKVSDIFKFPTIKQLLADTTGEGSVAIPKRSQNIGPLSFSQQRLWFIESYEGGTNAYHMPMVLEVLDTTDSTMLEKAVRSVVKRHEVLRSIIVQGDNQEGQQEVKEAPLAIAHHRCNVSEYTAQLRSDMDRPFDLEKEYPLRVCFYEVLDKEGKIDRYVLIMMHHIAGDGWSMEVFASELDSYYKAYTSGDTAFELPELPIQYSDYAV